MKPESRMTFSDIFELLESDLKRVEEKLHSNFRSDVPLISTISAYLSNSGGKRIRPILVLLTSKMFGYNGGERDIVFSCVVEFIHTATLLHDDVVDEAELRRGNMSANHRWGNEASVLVGDFLFSKSFSLMAEDRDPRLVLSVSEASKNLAEGEVLQLVNTCNVETTEEQYLDIIFRKTAALFSSCCQIGSVLGNASAEEGRAMMNFGKNFGIAFQLMDDVLDFVGDFDKLGKPLGTDLIDGNVTLPLMHGYWNGTDAEKERLKQVVNAHELSQSDLEEIVEMLRKYNSFEYTVDLGKKYAADAQKELEPFEDSPYLEALKSLADYTVEREY